MKLIVNCHSFPPADKGGAGAVKYAQAVLRMLGQKVDTTVIVSPANRDDYAIAGVKQLVLGDVRGNHDLFHAKDAVFFNPANILSPVDLPAGLPVVSMLHDYQHLVRPEWHMHDGVASRNSEYGFAVLRSDLLVCISRWELANLKKFYGAEHGRVIYHAPFLYEMTKSSRLENDAGKYQAKPFFLYPAVPWVHKNHMNLLTALDLIQRDDSNNFDFEIVLTGFDSTDPQFDVLLKRVAMLKEPHLVRFEGHVSDINLAHLMKSAKGLIFPSVYEGFGIPVVDAMSFGLPVLAAREAAVPEVAGDGVDYFTNPHDACAMAKDILEFNRKIDKSEYDVEQAKVIASQYEQNKMTDELLEVCKEALSIVSGGNRKLSCDLNSIHTAKNQTPVCIVIDTVFDEMPAEQELKALKEKIHNADIAFVVSYETAKNDTCMKGIRQHFPDAAIAYSPSNRAVHSIIMYNLLKLSVGNEYIAYFLGSDIELVNCRDLEIGRSYLEVMLDLFSTWSEALPNPIVVRPDKEEQAIPKFAALRKRKDREWLKHFSSRLMRRARLMEKGAPGSTSLLSYDCLQASSIKF